MSSPIISGLIALSASGRLSVSVPISPSTSILSVFSSGGRGRCHAVLLRFWSAGTAAYPLCDGREPLDASSAEQLPDRPGVYVFRDARGTPLYVGKANSIRKRVASSLLGQDRDRRDARPGRGRTRSSSWSPRTRPRRCSPSRASSSATGRASTSGCATTSPIPTSGSASTRSSRASTSRASATGPSRAYFGPFSTAKRVRETLDLLGKLFQYRTCEGPEPGRRSGVPCLDYYIKRCQAPCVGYIDREEYRRNIDRSSTSSPAATARSSATSRARWRRPRRPRTSSAPRSSATGSTRSGSLMERQRVAGGSLGSADLIGVAVEGNDANAQVFQVRDGVLAERQGFYLANDGERDEAEVAEEFMLQYYGAAPCGAAAGRRRPRAEGAGRGARRGARAAARQRGRGPAPRSAATSAGCASWPSATPGSRWPRTSCAASTAASSAPRRSPRSRRRSGWSGCRCGSRASTSPTSAETHTVASMVVFEGGAPKKSDYRRSTSAATARGRARRLSPRWRRS